MSFLEHTRYRLSRFSPYLKVLGSGYGLMMFNMLAQLLVVPMYLTNFGKWGFGFLSILLALTPLLALGITWVSGGSARLMGEAVAIEDEEKAKEIYSLTKYLFTCYGIIISSLVLIIGIIFEDYWLGDEAIIDSEQYLLTLISYCLYIIIQYEFTSELTAFAATKRQYTGNLLQGINPLVMLSTVWYLLQAGYGMYSVFWAMGVGFLVMRFATYLFWSKSRLMGGEGRYVRMLSISVTQIKLLNQMWRQMAVGYTLYGIVTLILLSDILLIGWLLGAEAAGIFAILWKIPNLLIQALWRIPGYAEPYIIHMDAKGEREQLVSLYKKGVKYYGTMCLIAGMGYGALGIWLVDMWVGKIPELDSYIPFILAGGAVFFMSVVRWPISIMYAMVRLGALIRISVIEVFLKLILIGAFLSTFGFLSTLVAINLEFVCFILFFYFASINKELKRS